MKFSIITATFNSLPGLQAAEAQVQAQIGAQSAIQIEHIVIDGGSTDGTTAWLAEQASAVGDGRREIEDRASFVSETTPQSPISNLQSSAATPHYQLRWFSEPDKGLYDALNKGLRLATGDLIGILHTDDVWEEGVLARVAERFEVGIRTSNSQHRTSNVERRERETSTPISDLRTPIAHPEGVYSDLFYVDAEDIRKVRRVWKAGCYDPKKFYNGWMPPHTTLFVTRELAQRVGEYRLDLGSAADYEWMLRACLVHDARLVYLPEVLVRMRVGGASNATFKGRLKAHGADRKAWEINGLTPKSWTLKMKVIRKIPQWVRGWELGRPRPWQ